jgi:hypothetical protein
MTGPYQGRIRLLVGWGDSSGDRYNRGSELAADQALGHHGQHDVGRELG